MIEGGQVECLKASSSDTSTENSRGMFGQKEDTLVRTLYEGDHFGELALLTQGGKRTLSVRVGGDKPCVLLYLDRSDFSKIVGNISKYLKLNYGGEFDKRFAGITAAREQAQKRGRRTTVTGELVDRSKLKMINGFDATIVEERSGEGSSALGSGR